MILADLHLHTTKSDGRLTPTELVNLAVSRGLEVIAITDHDSTEGLEEAFEAAKQALKLAAVKADQVDMIIVCTSSPDVLFPSSACFVQKELEAFNSAAYDISAVCSGFVFGLSIAEQYIKAGRYEHILVVGSEVNSRNLDLSLIHI